MFGVARLLVWFSQTSAEGEEERRKKSKRANEVLRENLYSSVTLRTKDMRGAHKLLL